MVERYGCADVNCLNNLFSVKAAKSFDDSKIFLFLTSLLFRKIYATVPPGIAPNQLDL